MCTQPEKIITFREGFSFVFTQKQKEKMVDVVGLVFNEELVLKGWMELTDFISPMEMALRGKLGTKFQHTVGSIKIYGSMLEFEGKEEFIVNIEITTDNGCTHDHLKLTSVECQQLVSKLNKVLHGANKYSDATVVDN